MFLTHNQFVKIYHIFTVQCKIFAKNESRIKKVWNCCWCSAYLSFFTWQRQTRTIEGSIQFLQLLSYNTIFILTYNTIYNIHFWVAAATLNLKESASEWETPLCSDLIFLWVSLNFCPLNLLLVRNYKTEIIIIIVKHFTALRQNAWQSQHAYLRIAAGNAAPFQEKVAEETSVGNTASYFTNRTGNRIPACRFEGERHYP